MEHSDNDKIIIANKPFDKLEFIRLNQIVMEVYSKLIRKEFIQMLFLAITLMLIVVLFNHFGLKSDFLFILSVLTLLLVIGGFIYLKYLKRKIQKKTQVLCEKYELSDFKSNYEIDKNGMSYCDNDRDVKYNWKDFKCCYLYKNYLILFDYKLLRMHYVFENNDSFAENYNILLNYVQKNLKIKIIH